MRFLYLKSNDTCFCTRTETASAYPRESRPRESTRHLLPDWLTVNGTDSLTRGLLDKVSFACWTVCLSDPAFPATSMLEKKGPAESLVWQQLDNRFLALVSPVTGSPTAQRSNECLSSGNLSRQQHSDCIWKIEVSRPCYWLHIHMCTPIGTKLYIHQTESKFLTI